MKLFGKLNPKFLASLAIFIFAINSSFALNLEVQEHQEQGHALVQADTNNKSAFVEENFGLDLVRSISQIKSNSFGGSVFQDISNFRLIQKTCFQQEKVYRFRDKRDFISQQLFPYHFFW